MAAGGVAERAGDGAQGRASTASRRRITPAEVVAKLARGDVYLRTVTFPEGLTIRQMAALFEQRRVRPGERLRGRGWRRRSSSPTIDPAARNLEGYLFPDTYALPRRRVRARTWSGAWWQRFESVMTADLRAEAAAARGCRCARP